MAATTVDLLFAATKLLENDCVGDDTTADLLDLQFSSQVSTCVLLRGV